MTGKSSRIYSFYLLCHYFNIKNPIHIGLQDTFIVMGDSSKTFERTEQMSSHANVV